MLLAAYQELTTPLQSHFWMYDTGSNINVCNNMEYFIFYEDDALHPLVKAGGTLTHIKGYGNVKIMVKTPNNEVKPLVIENVAYIPDFHVNIMAGKTFHKRNLFWNPQAGYI